MSVRRMLTEIDSRELTEWMAYDQIDPIGRDRFDLLAGMIVSAQLAPHLKKGAKIPTAQDLMPKWGEAAPEQKPQSPADRAEEMKRKFLGLTASMNGTIT